MVFKMFKKKSEKSGMQFVFSPFYSDTPKCAANRFHLYVISLQYNHSFSVKEIYLQRTSEKNKTKEHIRDARMKMWISLSRVKLKVRSGQVISSFGHLMEPSLIHHQEMERI